VAERLPTFLVIGAMKAGTTSLWQYLRAHPQVFMPEPKELYFFSDSERYARGGDWYRAHFAAAGDAVAVGEACTNYAKYPRNPGVAARVAETLPDARLVYLVREPLARIRSHYLHAVDRYGERRPLAVAVREDSTYLDFTRYSMQLAQYLEHFDATQLLVVCTESLRAEPDATIARALEFIGADPSLGPTATPVELNRGRDKWVDTAISARLRRVPGYQLARRFTPRSLRRVGSGLTKVPLTSTVDVTMPDDLVRWIADELADDIARLRPIVGPVADNWLDAPASP
jgi:hypothetical protein